MSIAPTKFPHYEGIDFGMGGGITPKRNRKKVDYAGIPPGQRPPKKHAVASAMPEHVIRVGAYTRSDGTDVREHYRSARSS